ncbi:MAG: type II toxin-antitoxin system HicB family antitoxin [Bacteroidia bacterium]|nr:type II toxin-antitoxin system HicB family antitoxin [Bacteroidia bacterium]
MESFVNQWIATFLLDAYVQEIPGINTQGETIEEAKENLADAVNLVFEEMRATIKKGRTSKLITQTMTFSF